MPRKQDPIRKVTTKSGETRYRFIIDLGKRPDGRREQKCFTYKTLTQARDERARIIADRSRGTLVKPSKTTVGQAIETWLAGRRNLRPSTQANYVHTLRLVSSRLGHVQLQNLTKGQLDQLVTDLLKSGRRVGNVRSQSLSPRSVNLMLTLLGSVLEDSVRQGALSRNVARMVERPRQVKKEMRTWTAEQARTFLDAVADDRLSAAFRLSLYGLRRSEVLGLRWSDIDLQAKTLTIRRSRVEVGSEVIEGEPKTERSRRTLPLSDGLVTALRSLKARQAQERLAAGSAYMGGCEGCGGEHLVVDELGQPLRPEWYTDRFLALSRAAGLPAIRLHDARHTSVTLMILNGVPLPVASKWHGHASVAFTLNVYSHSQDDALAAAGDLLDSVIRQSASTREIP